MCRTIIQALNISETIPIKNALKYMLQMIEGLGYLEANNYFHGSLTLENIIISEDLIVKINGVYAHYLQTLNSKSKFTNEENVSQIPLPWICPDIIKSSRSDVFEIGLILIQV